MTAWGQSRLALRAALTAPQWDDLVTRGYLEWRDPATGDVWYVPAINSMSVLLVPAQQTRRVVKAQTAHRLCLQIAALLPEPDCLLARYIAIQADPQRAQQIAGRVGVEDGPEQWVSQLQVNTHFGGLLAAPPAVLADDRYVAHLAEVWLADMRVWYRRQATYHEEPPRLRYLVDITSDAEWGIDPGLPYPASVWYRMLRVMEYEIAHYLCSQGIVTSMDILRAGLLCTMLGHRLLHQPNVLLFDHLRRGWLA